MKKNIFTQLLIFLILVLSFSCTSLQQDVMISSVDAENIEECRHILELQGYTDINVEPKKAWDIEINLSNKISVGDLAFDLTQLSTYIKAGIPLVDSVKIISQQASKSVQRRAYQRLLYDLLKEEHQIDVTLVNARFVKPFDKNLMKKLAKEHEVFVTLEDNVYQGGFGQQVTDFLYKEKLHPEIINISIPDQFVEHGSVGQLYEKLGMDAKSVVRKVLNCLVNR